ncbi:MAG: hypothetical protein WC071_10795 [Victivallaceae bacterium]
MKTQTANQYRLEKIAAEMANKFGKIKGQEEAYSLLLACMEGNMLKTRRINHKCVSRRAMEAVNMALMTVNGYLNGIAYDFGDYMNEENRQLYLALMKSFDPQHNDEIPRPPAWSLNPDNIDNITAFYAAPVKCLVRIKESVEFWMKKMGNDGYFVFIEPAIAKIMNLDDKMGFAVIVDLEEN